MDKIIISNDSTLESLRIRLSQTLPGSSDIAEKSSRFKPLPDLNKSLSADFFPSLLISGSADNAYRALSGEDELELFFMIALSKGNEDVLFEKILAAKPSLDKSSYLNLLLFLFLHAGDTKKAIISEIRNCTPENDPVAALVLSFYDEQPLKLSGTKTAEFICTAFSEALKAEKAGDYSTAFSLMLDVFEGSGTHSFIFEILKFYIMQYDGIPAEKVKLFIKKSVESTLPVSFTNLKFIEFLYYYRNNITEELESSVTAVAENTDSLFILNIIAPLLFRYKKWPLVGKFYKLSSKKTSGAEKTKYLELLADLYENKLELHDFAAEIYRSIVEEDPMNCSFSLKKAISIYEENESWDELASLLLMTAERETDTAIQASFYYKTAEILYHRLGKTKEAAAHLERSLALKPSFETARLLAGICYETKDFDRYIAILSDEAENAEPERKIKLLEKIAECCQNCKNSSEEAEIYLQKILEISPKYLPAVRKLGKIYNLQKDWEKLTEINFKEIDLTRDIPDIISLYCRNGEIFLYQLKDLTRATECFREILDIEPDHATALSYLEQIYSKTNDIAGLNMILSQISESDNENSETRLAALLRLASISRDSGKTKKAEELFREVLKTSPENLAAKENLRMIKGEADFSHIETDFINYTEHDLEFFIGYKKQSDLSLVTDECLGREDPSFWKELYFFIKKGIPLHKDSYSDSSFDFAAELLGKEFSIETLSADPTKKVALMLLAGEYIKAGFFEGISILFDHHLKFEPENKQKIWSLFFKGSENPDLKDELEELLMNCRSKQEYDIISELLKHIYIANKEYSVVFSLRNLAVRKLTDRLEKCRFLDSSIDLLSENISPDQLLNLYKQRIKLTEYEEFDDFLETYEKRLSEIGKETLLIPIYQRKWEQDKDIDSGEKLLFALIKDKENDVAADIAKQLLEKEFRFKVFSAYIQLVKRSEDIGKASDKVKEELAEQHSEEEKIQLEETLFDLLLETDNIKEATGFFRDTEFFREKAEAKTISYIKAGKFGAAEETAEAFISDTFKKNIFISEAARGANDSEKEQKMLEPLFFEALSRKESYPLKRLAELKKENQRFQELIKNALASIGEKENTGKAENFPHIFAADKDEIFDFAEFSETEKVLADLACCSSLRRSETKITAVPLNSSKHRILMQLIEYIKLSCNFDELEGAFDEALDEPCIAAFARVPYIIFGPAALSADFMRLKFTAIRLSFLLSYGIKDLSGKAAAEIYGYLQLEGREKVKFIKEIRPAFQQKALDAMQKLGNIRENETETFIRKLSDASFYYAFSLVPDIAAAKDQNIAKMPEFVSKYFM